MDPEEKRKQIELDILKIIEEKLANGEMEPERASEIARMVLDKLHPPLTLEQIYNIVPTLDDHFAELAKAVTPIEREHRDEVERVIASHAEKLIKQGEIEKATDILKQATETDKPT